MVTQEGKNFREQTKERIEKLKNGLIKGALKLFYNDEDRGKNCFEYLSSLNKKICTDLGHGELIDEPSGLIAGRHTFWDQKSYADHCISEFKKKCQVDYCLDQDLVQSSSIESVHDEL